MAFVSIQVRVPAVVWSAAIAASPARGTRSNQLYSVVDWLPTLAGLAGAPLPGTVAGSKGGSKSGGGDGDSGHDALPSREHRVLDGMDVWGSLLDPQVSSPRTEVLINANPLPCDGVPAAGDLARQAQLQQGAALIMVVAGHRYKLCIPDAWPPQDPASRKYMYDLDLDKAERTNLINSTAHRPVVESLMARLEFHVNRSVVPMTWFAPFQGLGYACAGCPLGKPSGPLHAWLPWM